MERLETLFTDNHLRLTKPRKELFRYLNDTTSPQSLSELRAALPHIERTSLYRTLELFESLSIITIIHVGWKKRYELADPFKPHHHHLVCTQCHAVTAVHPPELEQFIAQLSQDHGFTPTNHHFEIRGKCKVCQLANT